MKGITKGLTKITHLFAKEKEKELEIGGPTDVKHVAHIGSDGDAAAPPSWMGGFNAGADSSQTGSSNPGTQSSDGPKKKRKKNKGRKEKKPKSRANNGET